LDQLASSVTNEIVTVDFGDLIQRLEV
jgi:hypothetical protein